MKKITEAIKLRILYGKLLLTGNLSFSLAAFFMLPAFMRPKMDSIKSFSIYGKPFITPKGPRELRTALNLIHEIIGLNQYRIQLIKNDAVVIDAGANTGVFSIFVAANHPRSAIHAFEPTPSTFEALKTNTRYYPNIKIYNFGLGEKEKKASILLASGSGGNYIGERGIPVQIKTLDSFNLPADFIKIDTEGYEANILRGAAETLKKYKPIIVMSAYHKPNDETELPALLNSIVPYDCELRQDCEKDFTCTPKR